MVQLPQLSFLPVRSLHPSAGQCVEITMNKKLQHVLINKNPWSLCVKQQRSTLTEV